LNGDNPVIGLCIGTNVIIQSIKPYSVPSKSNDVKLSINLVNKKATINGKAIPARVPFKSERKRLL
jgi:hypothetical protein